MKRPRERESLSRRHKDWTDEERREAARLTHAKNRLSKFDRLVLRAERTLEGLRSERKRLRKTVKEGDG